MDYIHYIHVDYVVHVDYNYCAVSKLLLHVKSDNAFHNYNCFQHNVVC